MIEKIKGNIKDRLLFTLDFVNEKALLGGLNLLFLISKNDGKKYICYYSKSKNQNVYSTLYKYKKEKEFSVMSSTVAYQMGFLDKNGSIKNDYVESVPQNTLFCYEDIDKSD